mmetsp:Transcript_87288/g.260391  ORF Transcript_87288/g.260391 Transcript_87288/m.260391 type:complete len:218 (+) Transcript_87288:49-702(+)
MGRDCQAAPLADESPPCRAVLLLPGRARAPRQVADVSPAGRTCDRFRASHRMRSLRREEHRLRQTTAGISRTSRRTSQAVEIYMAEMPRRPASAPCGSSGLPSPKPTRQRALQRRTSTAALMRSPEHVAAHAKPWPVSSSWLMSSSPEPRRRGQEAETDGLPRRRGSVPSPPAFASVSLHRFPDHPDMSPSASYSALDASSLSEQRLLWYPQSPPVT